MSKQSHPPAVVVIDDSRANLLAMEGLLAPLGYRIALADNAEEGLRQALEGDVALIVADVRMPHVDGFQLLARLKERPAPRKAPVIFLSGYGYDSEQARRAYELGALDYVLKPVDPDILRAKVAALVTLFEQAREIEERDRTIVDQAARAEAAIREKDRYIGVLGHDLRNPLSALTMGLSSLTRSKSLSDAERQKIERMSRSAARMATMIRDLLDYTRTSIGEFPHHPIPTDLKHICETVVEELRATHPDRNVLVDVRGDVTGTWDPERLQQVISNLVGNALEHGDGTVSVWMDAADDEVVMSVHNDGEPIPAEVLPVLFEPFRRGDQSPKGLGLGLYIVREVIRRHGGTIEVRSSADAGTTFISRWPRHSGTPDVPHQGNPVSATPENLDRPGT